MNIFLAIGIITIMAVAYATVAALEAINHMGEDDERDTE